MEKTFKDYYIIETEIGKVYFGRKGRINGFSLIYDTYTEFEKDFKKSYETCYMQLKYFK